MKWNIFWTIVCLLIGGIVISAIESINSALYPWPEGLKKDDPEAMAKYIATLPRLAMWVVISAYFFGVLVSTFLATRFSTNRTAVPALVIGALFFLAGVAQLFLIPSPLWFAIVSLLTFPLAAFLGIKLGRIGVNTASADSAADIAAPAAN